MPESAPPRSATSSPRAYHHGDLRRALIDAATEILRSEGPDAMTLRAVARVVGVSQAAPYRHFEDRRALVAAVAEESFGRFGEALMRGLQSGEGGKGFRQLALAYVRFAHENPAEYRVMFGADLADHSGFPTLQERSRAVLQGVVGTIAQLQGAGIVGPGDPSTVAVATWSMLHGLVMLSLDGQTAGLDVPLDTLVDEVCRIMMYGMAPRRPDDAQPTPR